MSSTSKCSFEPKKTARSAQFHAEEVTEQSHTLERSELDLVVLSQLQTLGKNIPPKSQCARSTLNFTSRENAFAEQLFRFCIRLVRNAIATFYNTFAVVECFQEIMATTVSTSQQNTF